MGTSDRNMASPELPLAVVVAPDPAARDALSARAAAAGYRVVPVASIDDARRELELGGAELVVIDRRITPAGVAALDSAVPVVVMSAVSPAALEAKRRS